MGENEAQTGGFGCVSPSHPGWKPAGPSRASSVPAWNRKTGTGKLVPTPLPAFDSQPWLKQSLFPSPLSWTWFTVGFIWFRVALLSCSARQQQCLGCCNTEKAFGCIYVYWNVLFMVRLHTPFPLFSLFSSHLKTNLLKAEGKNN